MYLLTASQRNIWNLQKFYPQSSISIINGLLIFDEQKNLEMLKKAINIFVQKQEGIRLQFTEKGSDVYQYVSEYKYFDIPVMSFSNVDEAKTFFQKDSYKTVNMTNSVMYRFCIFVTPQNCGIYLCFNHIVCDAWTASIFCRDVINNYDLLLQGKTVTDETITYVDYIKSEEKYLTSNRYTKDKEYWSNRFTEQPTLKRIKPYCNESDEIKAERIVKTIKRDVADKIRSWCSNNSVSIAVIFEAVIFSYLYRINEKTKEVIIGTPILNRSTMPEKNIAGMFVSTMPLGVSISDDDTVLLLCNKITDSHRELFRHQKFSYSEILKIVRDKYESLENLFDVMVSYQNAVIGNDTDTAYSTEWLSNGFSEIPLEFHIDDRDSSGCFTINLDYQTAVFSSDEIEYLYNRIYHILEQFLDNNLLKVKDIKIMPQAEYDQVVYGFNDTYVEYPRDKCVHELFADQVHNTPNKVTLIFEDKQFTYKQLDEMSNSLAHYLQSKGIKRNDIIPIISVRSWHIVVAMLGILKAGGAFMPIDPSYPDDRINYMIEEANSNFVLSYGFNKDLCVEKIPLETFDFSKDTSPVSNKNIPTDSCYVIFTSGSTGKPKGVIIEHKNLNNYCNSNNKNVVCGIICDTSNCILSVTNYTFDIFMTESIMALLNKITIYLTNDVEANSSEAIKSIILNHNIKILQTTPTKMKLYINNQSDLSYLNKLDVIILGGEPFQNDLYLKLKDNTQIYNIYGPTETTVWSAYRKMTSNDVTIGKPIANTQVYILATNGNPCPIGVAGELCISGDGVGKGYLNRPELTEEKFVENPFIKGNKMYKTGDLARWRSDGEIEYLGRIDTQVKIRGLRIELGEIESVLSSYDGISNSVVADKRDENNRQYLVGYYVSDSDIDAQLLRSHLSKALPHYMIPNYFMRLIEIPLTSSGKTDRKNLPEPIYADITEEYVSPETHTEKILADLWKEILNVNPISKNSNFIDCGGDSLEAMQLLVEIEEKFNVEIEFKMIMEHPVLSDLAKAIDNSNKRSNAILSLNLYKYELTPQQKAIYLACQKDPNSLVYNMPMLIRFDNVIDIDFIKHNLNNCIKRHSNLRTNVVVENNNILGQINDNVTINIEAVNDINSFARPFDLSKSPLMRVGLGENYMLIDIHHLVADGESITIILDEILNGSEHKESVNYADYSAYFYSTLRNDGFKKHSEYFKSQLNANIDVLELPPSTSRCSTTSYSYSLKVECIEKINKISKLFDVTPTCVYFTAYNILLSRYANRNDFVTSIILSNRSHSETKSTCGMFVNTIPVAIKIDNSITLRQNMKKLNAQLMDILDYQEYPFLEICNDIGLTDKNAINTTFVYQPFSMNFGEKHIEYVDTNTHKMGLSFQVVPMSQDENVDIILEFDNKKYDIELMKRLAKSYESIIEQLTDDVKIANVDVMGKSEYDQVVYKFNDTYAEYPRDKCVHELFEDQVRNMPNKVALIFEDKQFTYKQLDEMSNSLAHYLQSKGIERNDIVPIISVRSWHIVVAMLGILKAGGAFMPIDPNYPNDRINYMIEEASSNFVLSYGFNKDLCVEKIFLETFDFSKDTSPVSNKNIPTDSCYVIFTSGSTGKPKGAILRHIGLVNFSYKDNLFHKPVFGNCNNVLAVGSFTFDISLVEIYQPLLNGKCIIIADEKVIVNSEAMSAAIKKYNVDFIHLTPTRLNYFLENENFKQALFNVKVILSAGEAFSSDLYKKIRSCTNAEIYNGYGPTETTVGCSFARVTDPNDVTIGKPISNVQIYILDINGNPCPIGVAGELCISGDGVGKGYLNRPELTEEKFVENPFIKGSKMYKTGDLARWRSDGEIEYLGRIDTQVKIRGLRIELGEIESVLNSYDGISNSVVADKRDENNRQYLVGYYVSDNDVDEKALRKFMKSRLPQYMIPNYFVRLNEIPTNTSGKTDRKNLPSPVLKIDDYVSPRNDLEKTLCEIAAEVLDYERIGIKSNFFDLGGDSLRAMEFTTIASEKGISFNLQSIFENPTIEKLCKVITEKSSTIPEYYDADFEEINNVLLSNTTKAVFRPTYKTLGNVLLTGATGFLGVHILDSLMKYEKGLIYCLVRGNSYSEIKERLKSTLNYYFDSKYDSEIEKRIIPIKGDILSEKISDNLPDDIDTIIHSAAMVKHYGDYSQFYAVNVKGTENVLNTAIKFSRKFIFISTVSVSGSNLTQKGNGTVRFSESDLYIHQNLSNVYIRSKFEAEKLVLGARANGADCTIFRVGNLTNRFSDGKFQPNYNENAFLRRIKTFVDLKAYPSSLSDIDIELSPVDDTADTIIKLAENAADCFSVFHVDNPNTVTYGQLVDMFRRSGRDIYAIDMDKFVDKLHSVTNADYNTVLNDINEMTLANDYIKVVTDNDFTDNITKQIGCIRCKVTKEYIKMYSEYFEKLNYWSVEK